MGCGPGRLCAGPLSLTANAQAGYCRTSPGSQEPTPTAISKAHCVSAPVFNQGLSVETQLFERPLSAPCLQHPLVSYAGSTW